MGNLESSDASEALLPAQSDVAAIEAPRPPSMRGNKPFTVRAPPKFLAGGPLFMAAQKGELTTVRSLVENKADMDRVNSDGCTALFVSSEKGKLDVVKLLVDSGAKVLAPPQPHRTSCQPF